MQTIASCQQMHSWSKNQKQSDKTLSFIPTMGALHQGHISLIRKAKELSKNVVVSIYVNPTQFAPHEDLDSYPRTLTKDLEICENEAVSAVFTPNDQEMYPHGESITVNAGQLGTLLCGASRPGHFDGVTTVLAKLFNIVQPDYSIFGEKDFQQLVIIKKMSADLNFPGKIIAAPIVRAADGLAMSSRNRKLALDERKNALCLYQALSKAKEIVDDGIKDSNVILANAKEIIKMAGAKLDYAALVDEQTLLPVALVRKNSRLCLAAYLGDTRLIDNCSLA